MPKWMKMIEAMAGGEQSPPPIAQLIGFRVTTVRTGYVQVEFDAQPRHANPMGTLHGGVFCDIADAAMGMAYITTLMDDETFTTLELKINFLKPVWNGKLIATGQLVKGGKTIGLVECHIHDQDETLVAYATSTCMTLRGVQAHGRKMED